MSLRRLALSFLVSLVSLASVAAPAQAAQPTFPGISRIGLVPPPDLTPSRHFAGFESPADGTVVLFNELPPEAYDQLSATLTPEGLAGDELKIVSRSSLPGVGEANTYVVADRSARAGGGRRLVLLVKGEITGLVTVQLSPKAKKSSEAVFRNALTTYALRGPLSPAQQLDGLPFAMGDLEGFRLVKTLSGNAALLTDGPLDVVKGAEQPFVVAAAAFSPVGDADRESFGRRSILNLPQTREVRIERDQSTGIGEGGSSEIVATARSGDTGDLVVIYQFVRFTKDGYLRVIGQGKLDQREALLPRFRKIAAAVSLRP